jgi:hypothetical protein
LLGTRSATSPICYESATLIYPTIFTWPSLLLHRLVIFVSILAKGTSLNQNALEFEVLPFLQHSISTIEEALLEGLSGEELQSNVSNAALTVKNITSMALLVAGYQPDASDRIKVELK